MAVEPRYNELQQPIGFELGDWVPPPTPSREVMTGMHCRLEPLDAEKHGRALYQAYEQDSGGRRWTYLSYGPFDSLATYLDWIAERCRGDDPLFFAIVDPSGSAVGVAGYLRIDPANGSLEVGHLNFAPCLQKTVAATEAMYLMMRQAFELGYRRYEWKCDALNGPSRRAAQRLGLSLEGIFRQATHYKGRNRDTAWFAAIDREWPQLDAVFRRWLAPENFDPDGRQRTRLSQLTAPILKRRDPGEG